MLRSPLLTVLATSLTVGCFPDHLACRTDADCPAPTWHCNVEQSVCHIPGADGGAASSSSSGAPSSSTSSSSGSSSSSSSSTGGWQDLSNSPGLADLTVNALAFSPDDARVLYVAQNDSVCVTTNSGGSFNCHAVCNSCSVTSLAAVPGVTPPSQQVLAGTSQEIYRSDDRGGTWTRKADTSAGGGGTLVAVDADTPAVMAAITRNGHAYRSTDGGDTWVPAGSPSASLTQIRDLMFSTHALYASGTGGVYRAVPPVSSWTQWGSVGSGAQRTLRDRVFQGTFYAVSSDRRLWKTSNEGGSFTEVMAGTPVGALDIQTPSSLVGRVLWVAGDRTVYRNTSDTGGFEALVVDGNPAHQTTVITALAVAPTDADVVAVTFNQNAHLVITTHGGR